MYERRYDLLKNKFNEFFIPTLLTTIANNICLFSDSLIVSFLIGSYNLAAIQVVVPIVTFINLIYWAIGLGGSVLMSSAKEEFDETKSNTYFTVSVISLVIIGIASAVVGWIFINDIVYLLCSSEVLTANFSLSPLVHDYLVVLFMEFHFYVI